MRRTLLALLTSAALLAGACAATEDGTTSTTAASSETSAGTDTTESTAPDGDLASFGTLESPCGPGDGTAPTVSAEEGGLGTDKLYIGVGNDRTSIRPGLLKELWDGTTAFVSWCNEQGGINGLPLEAVDLDGQLFQLEPAMAKACTDVFAIVGGGWAQDNLIYSGKADSDPQQCGLIAFPGFAVTPDFAEANDVVQAEPNPARLRATAVFEGLAAAHPDKVDNFAVVFGNLDMMRSNSQQTLATVAQVDGYGGFAEFEYDAISQDWMVLARRIVDSDTESIFFVGEPPSFAQFNQQLLDQGYEGVMLTETNLYDARTIAASGPEAVEGVIVRSYMGPFEEADSYPATKQMMEILDQYVPNWERAALIAHAFSASLLFATAAKQCADEDGTITRVCVLQAGQAIDEWDAGGLLAPTNPAESLPPECAMLLQVRNGSFVRLYPEVDGDGDDLNGFHCSPLVEIEGNFGEGVKVTSILDG